MGIPCSIVRDPAKLSDVPPARVLLVDLNLPGAIEAAARYRQLYPETAVVGFVSHTDAATIAAARQAGLEKVLARSAFVEQLPTLLQKA